VVVRGGEVAAYWDDPLPIRGPVELIKATLRDHLGVSGPLELTVSIKELTPFDG